MMWNYGLECHIGFELSSVSFSAFTSLVTSSIVINQVLVYKVTNSLTWL
jgi:hypothetical protein